MDYALLKSRSLVGAFRMPDLKIGLLGATGRMGRALANEILAQSGLILTAAGERPDNESVEGQIRPHHHKIQAVAVTKNAEVVFERSEVVLDFTEASAAVGHARLAAATNTPLLIGTTGLSKNNESEIVKHAANIAILRSRNTSRGIALLTLAIEELS